VFYYSISLVGLLGLLTTSFRGITASGSIPAIVTVEELGPQASDEIIHDAEVGQQVSIRTLVTNRLDRDQEAVILNEL